MWEHNAKHAQATATPNAGSRRRRLWDLSHECHCPVVGVCLPLDSLRRLVNKSLGGKAVADDYEVHVGAVAQCAHRNRLSEALQAELERRFALDIQRFNPAKTPKALAAALSHPRCDAILQEVLFRDMHMMQHQTGASVRIEAATFTALHAENAVLARELGRVQERCTRLLAEKSNEVARLTALHMRAQAANIAKDSQLGIFAEELVALRASHPTQDASARLQKKIDHMVVRQEDLKAQNAALRHKLAAAAKALEAVGAETQSATKTAIAPTVSPVRLYLNQKTVLCVGGRTGNIANYRDLIERGLEHMSDQATDKRATDSLLLNQ